MQIRRRSSLWFLLPIVFNIFGGVVAYFVIRDDDPRRARSCLLLGAVLAAIPILLFVAPILVGIAILPHIVPHISGPTMNRIGTFNL
ncbi:MAG: hypothetical protein KGI33_07180 [Thaumarchaeota archaeon]|nr:hypothetical protein [Nitrososphaerota archaeon]